METQTVSAETVVATKTVRKIKRYKNRKLYDILNSSYVNLGDLLGFVKNGEDVLIVNSDTNEDITAEFLLKAFIDGELSKDLSVSLGAIKSLIANGL